jgi:hypothetical protein
MDGMITIVKHIAELKYHAFIDKTFESSATNPVDVDMKYPPKGLGQCSD